MQKKQFSSKEKTETDTYSQSCIEHERKQMQMYKTSKATVTAITTGQNDRLQNSSSERSTRPILKHSEYKYTPRPLFLQGVHNREVDDFSAKFADRNVN